MGTRTNRRDGAKERVGQQKVFWKCSCDSARTFSQATEETVNHGPGMGGGRGSAYRSPEELSCDVTAQPTARSSEARACSLRARWR